MKELKKLYEAIADDYLVVFGSIMGINAEDAYWVGDKRCVASIGDYFVNYDDIRFCVDNDVSFEMFDEWYQHCLDKVMKNRDAKTPSLMDWKKDNQKNNDSK